MEEIKVGEYVRTNEGYIAKMKHYGINKGINGKSCLFDNQIRDISVSVYDQDNFLFDDELDKYIVKHSPNIIDLIKVGDLIVTYPDISMHEVISKNNNYIETLEDRYVTLPDIMEIVTKEQIEKMKYKL